MLQALKVDPGPRPPTPRDPDPAPDFLNQAFAGYLATAANLVGCPLPSGAAPAPPAAPKPAPEPRNGPSPSPVSATRPEATKAPKADSESTPASPKRAADPGEGSRPKAPDSTRPEAASKEPPPPEPAKGAPESTSLTPPESPRGVAQTITPPGLANPWAEITAPAEATPATPNAPASAPRMRMIPSGTAAPADATPKETAPTAPARFHFSEDAQASGAKPALTELLAIPLPEMETPKPLQALSRMETTPLREAPLPGAVASFKPVETFQVSQAAPSMALATAIRDPAAVMAPKADTTPLKLTPAGSPSTGLAPGTPIRGTTPVPSAEGAQGAKAQATFTQMDGTIRWLLKSQEKGAEIQLNPESLGRVVIKLRVEGSEVHARVWASEAATVPLLQDQRASLEASLRQQGLSLGSFNLQQGHRGDDSRATAQPSPARIGAGIAETREQKQDLPIAPPTLPGGARLIELLA